MSDDMSDFRGDLPPPDPEFFTRTSMLQMGYGVWANLVDIIIGMAIGFTAVAIPQMKEDPALGLGEHDVTYVAWFASTISLTSIAGSLLSGFVLDMWGRKFALVVSGIPFLIGWIILSVAYSKTIILIGRTITGLGIGMSFPPSRIYCSEIALPNMRGVLASFMNTAVSLGIMTQAILGWYLSWRHICMVNSGVTGVVMFVNIFLPESPYYLLMKHETLEDVKKSLKHFRARNHNMEAEMNMLEDFKILNNIFKLSWRHSAIALFKSSSCKPLAILIVLLVFITFSGLVVMTFWTLEVLKDSRTSVDEHLGYIVLATTRIVGCLLSTVIIYKIKRRTMSICAGTIAGCCLLAIGVHVTLMQAPNISSLIYCVLFVLSASVGFLTVPFLLMSELYPLQVRGMLSGITVAVANLLIFIVNMGYAKMRENIGFAYCMFIFGGCSLMGSLYAFLFLPETKDLTLQEIEEYYNETRPTLTPSRAIVSAQQLHRKWQRSSSFLQAARRKNSSTPNNINIR